MGNPKQRWTAEEEEALKAGVAKHGAGRWKAILVDAEFAPKLYHRSNVDLKDKWRNMGANGRVFGDNFTRLKATVSIPIAEAPKILSNCPVFSLKERANNCPAQIPQDPKNIPKCDEMILEALASLKDPNGSDAGAIAVFIERRYEVRQTFRSQLSSKLRRLVLQGKLEKVLQRYKMKDVLLGMKTPFPKQKDVRPKPLQQFSSIIYNESELVRDAAKKAARWLAEAEHKALLTSDVVKESERVSQMAEDTEVMLVLAKELYIKCSEGDYILLN